MAQQGASNVHGSVAGHGQVSRWALESRALWRARAWHIACVARCGMSIRERDEPSDATETTAWNLEQLVAALRMARQTQSDWRKHEAERRQRPSRDALVRIVSDLRAALFPSHFGVSDFTETSIDFFVGNTLDTALRALEEQVRRGLRYTARVRRRASARRSAPRASARARRSRSKLPEVRAALELDIRAAYDGDPAAQQPLGGDLLLPRHHRHHPPPPRPRAVSARRAAARAHIAEIAHSTTGIDIHPGARDRRAASSSITAPAW